MTDRPWLVSLTKNNLPVLQEVKNSRDEAILRADELLDEYRLRGWYIEGLAVGSEGLRTVPMHRGAQRAAVDVLPIINLQAISTAMNRTGERVN